MESSILIRINKIAPDEQVRIVAALVEGNSFRSTSRMTGIAGNTVNKLLIDLGEACIRYHDEHVRNVKVRRLQCDEIWAYVGAKARNVSAEKKEIGWGDVWTWVGLDADTKLVVSYFIGGRGAVWAMDFMSDCASRIVGQPQITTDAHKPYLRAVEEAFGGDAKYAVLHKVFGRSSEPETRYSPATCIGCNMKTISGIPDPKHVSTSYVERQSLTRRMSIRRFTRLTNGFSKKIEDHAYAVALHFMYMNYVRIHGSQRVTPAMEAGLATSPWTLADLLSIMPEREATKRGPYKPRNSN